MSRALTIEELPLDSIRPSPTNARTHSRHQISQIAASIGEFGFTSPILIDEFGNIIAGHGRWAAAKRRKCATVPVIRIPDLTEAQKRALALADNKIASNAGWDTNKLAAELEFLTSIEIDFDISVTGFEMAEVDLTIEGVMAVDDDADAVPEFDDELSPVSQAGDFWHLGDHRLLCGDALQGASFETLMGGAKAQMVFIDPPYNVPIRGHVSGLGKTQHREFPMASGELSKDAYETFLETSLGHLARHSADGSIHFICNDWRHQLELLTAAGKIYTKQLNLCVWNKSNAGMGSLYRSQHELILVSKSGTGRHINNVELGRHGRHRSNVWDYAGVNSFGADRMNDLSAHPTVKPVALIADAILDCSRRGGIILDSFVGSGSTIIAAERTGRRAYAMELDPGYVDLAIRRWQEFTGDAATHAATGTLFDDLIQARREKPACNGDGSSAPTITE